MTSNRVEGTPLSSPQAAAAEATPTPAPNPAGAPTEASPAVPVDRVSLSQVSEVKMAVPAAITMAASERSERLHHLTQAVRSGAYRPSESQLASQILAEAELDARLARAMS